MARCRCCGKHGFDRAGFHGSKLCPKCRRLTIAERRIIRHNRFRKGDLHDIKPWERVQTSNEEEDVV